MADAKGTVEPRVRQLTVLTVEKILITHKRKQDVHELDLLTKGLNNGKRQAIERIFSATKPEIEEAIMEIKDLRERQMWNWWLCPEGNYIHRNPATTTTTNLRK